MTSAPRRAATVLRNAPVTASVLARHIGRDRWKATSVLLRGLPTGVRTRLLGRLTDPTVLRALTLDADGDRPAARALLAELATTATCARLRDVVAAAATIHEIDIAETALARVPSDDPDRARLTALCLLERGRYTEALEALDAPGVARSRARSALASRLRGERDLFDVATRVGRAGGPAVRRPGGRPVERLRVLHVVTNALPEVQAGYTLRTQGIALAQAAAGHDVHVVTRLGFPVDIGRVAAERTVDVDGITHHRLIPTRPLPLTAAGRLDAGVEALAELVADLRPGVLHAHSKHDNAQLALAVGARLGIPVVYEVRGFLEETWRSRGGATDADEYALARAAEDASMLAADHVVAISESLRADVVSRGVPPERVSVVANSVADSFLQPLHPEQETAALRDSLGIPAGRTVFGIVSTLYDYEGLGTLIRALDHLVDETTPRDAGPHVLLVGDGPERAALEELAADPAHPMRAGRVTFAGRVPHARVREYHAAIDVFCVPRWDSPVTALVPPLKPLEAMASGRPVILSDLPALRELLADPDAGLLATPDDPRSWAAAMTSLYDAADRRTRGKAARAWTSEHRTWRAAVETYRRVYAGIGAAADTPTSACTTTDTEPHGPDEGDTDHDG